MYRVTPHCYAIYFEEIPSCFVLNVYLIVIAWFERICALIDSRGAWYFTRPLGRVKYPAEAVYQGTDLIRNHAITILDHVSGEKWSKTPINIQNKLNFGSELVRNERSPFWYFASVELSTDARDGTNSSQKQNIKCNTRFHWPKNVLVTVIRALVGAWVSMSCYCTANESRKDVHRDLILCTGVEQYPIIHMIINL